MLEVGRVVIEGESAALREHESIRRSLPRVLEPMAEFWQQVVSGLATGAIYASLALALVLIYRSTRVINFAQGEMATFSTFIAWQLIGVGRAVLGRVLPHARALVRRRRADRARR